MHLVWYAARRQPFDRFRDGAGELCLGPSLESDRHWQRCEGTGRCHSGGECGTDRCPELPGSRIRGPAPSHERAHRFQAKRSRSVRFDSARCPGARGTDRSRSSSCSLPWCGLRERWRGRYSRPRASSVKGCSGRRYRRARGWRHRGSDRRSGSRSAPGTTHAVRIVRCWIRTRGVRIRSAYSQASRRQGGVGQIFVPGFSAVTLVVPIATYFGD
jgi:hypothetical protein